MLPDLLALLAPPACLACAGVPLRGDVLCRGCRLRLRFLTSVCPRCGLPRPCGRRCPAVGLAFAAAWAPVAYEGPAAALVSALKERGALRAASLMAAQIVAGAPEGLLGGARGVPLAAPEGLPGGARPALVPVPADPLRRRRRGIDHAAALARAVAARSGLPVAPVLARGRGRRHAGASRRRRSDTAAVRVRGAPPLVAVLVDDVHTTGSTLHACAAALRDAGCAEVRAVCYARTLPSRERGHTV